MLDLVFGGCLLLYLVFVGIAVQRSIRALYSPLTNTYLVPSFLNHRYVATTFKDANSYLEHFSQLTPQEKLEQVVKQTWVDAKLMNRKRDAVGSAVRWVQLSLLMLGLLVLRKYVTLVVQSP